MFAHCNQQVCKYTRKTHFHFKYNITKLCEKKHLSQDIVLLVDAGAALAERVTIGIIANNARLLLEVDLNPPPYTLPTAHLTVG